MMKKMMMFASMNGLAQMYVMLSRETLRQCKIACVFVLPSTTNTSILHLFTSFSLKSTGSFIKSPPVVPVVMMKIYCLARAAHCYPAP